MKRLTFQEKSELALLLAVANRYLYSRPDSCIVAFVHCQECNSLYEEEIDTFREKILSGANLLCIQCDPRSKEPCFEGNVVSV